MPIRLVLDLATWSKSFCGVLCREKALHFDLQLTSHSSLTLWNNEGANSYVLTFLFSHNPMPCILCRPFKRKENLGFKNVWDSHMSFNNREESDYKCDLDLLIISHWLWRVSYPARSRCKSQSVHLRPTNLRHLYLSSMWLGAASRMGCQKEIGLHAHKRIIKF